MKSFQYNPHKSTSFRFQSNDPSEESINRDADELHPCVLPASGSLGFDYAGVYRPCREVPSNFLETESSPAGRVLFAIGDTGRSPDPLPLLCIRHYLRRNLSLEVSNPILVAKKMNELIYDCCAASCFLSCFYAQYTRATGVLRYINAGHESPVLIRSNPEEVLRLEKGGPVFGLQEASRYTEGAVHLRKGDRLVAFTQGIIESLAAHYRRSAESVLISLTRTRGNSGAAQLANRIVAECEYARSQPLFDQSVFVASVDDVIPICQSNSPVNAAAALACV